MMTIACFIIQGIKKEKMKTKCYRSLVVGPKTLEYNFFLSLQTNQTKQQNQLFHQQLGKSTAGYREY